MGTVANRPVRVARLQGELQEVLARPQAADILQIIASSPSGCATGVRCGCRPRHEAAGLLERDRDPLHGEYVQFGAARGARLRQFVRQRYQSMRPGGSPLLGRSLLRTHCHQHCRRPGRTGPATAGLLSGAWIPARSLSCRCCTRQGDALVLTAPRPTCLPDARSVVQTFADQAVIAIQNARLFNETKEALQATKASADILGVISNSEVADTQPIFDQILHGIEHPVLMDTSRSYF